MLVLLTLALALATATAASGNILATAEKPPSGARYAAVRSVHLSDSYLYPSTMRTEETCFGNSLTEVKNGDELKVVASRPFSIFFTTEFTDNYVNMQQYYRENLESITVNALRLSIE
jgi:hypothetical protein